MIQRCLSTYLTLDSKYEAEPALGWNPVLEGSRAYDSLLLHNKVIHNRDQEF